MPCEILMLSGFQPVRIAQDYDVTLLNLTQAISNNVPFMLSNDEQGRRVATRVSHIQQVIEVGEGSEE